MEELVSSPGLTSHQSQALPTASGDLLLSRHQRGISSCWGPHLLLRAPLEEGPAWGQALLLVGPVSPIHRQSTCGDVCQRAGGKASTKACILVFAPVTCLFLHVKAISSKQIRCLAGPAAIFNRKTFTCNEEDPRPLLSPAFALSDPPSICGLDCVLLHPALPDSLCRALHFLFQSSVNTLYIHNSVSICRDRNHRRL